MPRVPTYDNFQANDNSVQTARFNAPAAQNAAPAQAANMGNALGSLGGHMAKIQQDIDQTRVTESMNALMEQRLALTYKDGGFAHLSGKAALERPDGKSLSQEYGERLKKTGDDIASGLGNERQKKMFAQQLEKVALEFDSDITRHVAGESRKWQLSVQDGTQKTAINYAAMNYLQPDKVEQSRNAVKQSVYDKGQLLGKSAVEIAADQVDALSVMHSAVMTSAVDSQNIDYAREYYKQNESELNAPTRIQMTKLLEAGAFEKKTQDITDTLYSKHNGDMTAALAEARKTLSGKDEDAVVTRLQRLNDEKKAIQRQTDDENASAAWSHIANNQKVPTSLFASLNGKDQQSIKQVMDKGLPQNTDTLKWLEFTNIPTSAMAKMSYQDLMREYRPYFNDTDMRNANNILLSVRSGKKDGEGLQLMTVQDSMQRTAKELGILPKKGTPTEDQQADYLEFADKLQTKINAWEDANKRKASPEVLRDIMNMEKANKVYLDEWGRDPAKSLINVKTDELNNAYVTVGNEDIKLTAIPARRREQIIFALNQSNRAVTEQAIAEMWVQGGKLK